MLLCKRLLVKHEIYMWYFVTNIPFICFGTYISQEQTHTAINSVDFFYSNVTYFQETNFPARDFSQIKTNVSKIVPELDTSTNIINTNDIELINVANNIDKTSTFEKLNQTNQFWQIDDDRNEEVISSSYHFGPCMCSTRSFYVVCFVSMFYMHKNCN